jgi:hypothetical protein
MLRRVGASFVASLLLWLAALAAPVSGTHTSHERELERAGAFGARTICVDRTTLTVRVATPERPVSPTRWSPASPSCAQRIAQSHVRVHDVLLERVRAHVPLALRRTYDAHAPPALPRA